MAKPLLVIGQAEGFEKIMKSSAFYVKKTKVKKIKKAKVKVKAKKKVKAKPKVVEPVRPSPFSVGDEVWFERTTNVWLKSKIWKCMKPAADAKAWTYFTEMDKSSCSYEECKLIPAKILTLNATDAVRLKKAEFATTLNEVFGGETFILAVYRQGQKRPWAYYVIPDIKKLYKEITWKHKSYGCDYPQTATIYVHPVDKINLNLIPVSSAPQEILTYLGLHIYNRKWMNGEE